MISLCLNIILCILTFTVSLAFADVMMMLAIDKADSL